MAKTQLGRLLVERGLCTDEQVDAAIVDQGRTGRPIGRTLVEQGVITETDLVSTLAAQVGLRFVDLEEQQIDPTASGTISEALARRYQALPIAWEGNALLVAMADPSNVLAMDDIRSVTGRRGPPGGGDSGGHRRRPSTGSCALDADVEDATSIVVDMADEDDDLASIREVTEDAPIVKLVNLLIRQAVQDRASDIHIEPSEHDVRIRYRIDGVLHEVMRSPRNGSRAASSRRLKIMADIDIAEKRVPQDGRLAVGDRRSHRSTCASPPCPRCTARRSSCGSSTRATALLELSRLGFLPGQHGPLRVGRSASPTARSW